MRNEHAHLAPHWEPFFSEHPEWRNEAWGTPQPDPVKGGIVPTPACLLAFSNWLVERGVIDQGQGRRFYGCAEWLRRFAPQAEEGGGADE